MNNDSCEVNEQVELFFIYKYSILNLNNKYTKSLIYINCSGFVGNFVQ